MILQAIFLLCFYETALHIELIEMLWFVFFKFDK